MPPLVNDQNNFNNIIFFILTKIRKGLVIKNEDLAQVEYSSKSAKNLVKIDYIQ